MVRPAMQIELTTTGRKSGRNRTATLYGWEDGEDILLFLLAAENMHIGRSPAADILLDDASVSRRHALITKRGESAD